MRVVVAPDKFKGSLTAREAAEVIGAGVRDAVPGAQVTLCPVADGGEGSLDVLLAAGGRRVDLRVNGPLSEPVAAWYVVRDDIAYIESARACGIEHVSPSPEVALAAHSYGVGELIGHAVDSGARRLVLTVGGTASTDGGAGMLRALGADIRDAAGGPVDLGGGSLRAVARVDLLPVRNRLRDVAVRIATDVTNSLLGSDGAAAVFGPQKGAGAREVEALEASLRAWADAVGRAGGGQLGGMPGAGAGGGISGGAMAALRAYAESGFALIAELTGITSSLRYADLVITGEGSLDRPSLAGKAPVAVAAMAGELAVPVVAVAGRIELSEVQLRRAGFDAAYALADRGASLEYAQRNARDLLRTRSAELVRALAPARRR